MLQPVAKLWLVPTLSLVVSMVACEVAVPSRVLCRDDSDCLSGTRCLPVPVSFGLEFDVAAYHAGDEGYYAWTERCLDDDEMTARCLTQEVLESGSFELHEDVDCRRWEGCFTNGDCLSDADCSAGEVCAEWAGSRPDLIGFNQLRSHWACLKPCSDDLECSGDQRCEAGNCQHLPSTMPRPDFMCRDSWLLGVIHRADPPVQYERETCTTKVNICDRDVNDDGISDLAAAGYSYPGITEFPSDYGHEFARTEGTTADLWVRVLRDCVSQNICPIGTSCHEITENEKVVALQCR